MGKLEGLRILGAKTVILFDAVQPFLAAAFGWVFLGEKLRPAGLLGVVLTVCGVVLVSLEEQKQQEERKQKNSHPSTKLWKIADLGSADGSNSIRTINNFLSVLNNPDDATHNNLNLHIIFEEHPSSDEAKLSQTVSWWLENKSSHDSEGHKITADVLMKSFYEPLFEDNSIDFCMSYICLHWLDSTDIRGTDESGAGNAST